MLERIIMDIENSIKNTCYFAALGLALTLPDICGMAEFPKEKSVAKRYIGWYDEYIGKMEEKDYSFEDGVITPHLSGEVIYNLRNTFLHQGMPNITRQKVKAEWNQINSFILVLGNGEIIQEMSEVIDIGKDENAISVKCYMVDVSYLCLKLCDRSLYYYNKNKERFHFEYNIVDEKDLKDELSRYKKSG